MAHRDYVTRSNLRLKTIVRLRWIAIIGQLLTVFVVYFGFKFEFPLLLSLGVIGFSVVINLVSRQWLQDVKVVDNTYGTWMLAFDILQLALLLYLTGGILNPFASLLVAPIAISAASLQTRSTVIIAVLALSVASFISFFHLPLPWETTSGLELPFAYRIGHWIAILCAMTFIGFFAWRIATESRHMAAALMATEAVLAREQEFSAIDGLAAAAAHELGTPLSTISVVAKELERELEKDSPLRDDVVLIREQAVRCREILQSLSDGESGADFLVSKSSIGEVLQEAAQPFKALNANIEIKFEVKSFATPPFDREPLLSRSPGMIYALSNIIENAVEFAQKEAEIIASWSETELKIIVQDDGPGFSTEMLNSLGEPFISSRSMAAGLDDGAQYGMGLGFFISKTLLERSGAVMKFGNRNAPERGAYVSLIWPRHLIDLTMDASPSG